MSGQQFLVLSKKLILRGNAGDDGLNIVQHTFGVRLVELLKCNILLIGGSGDAVELEFGLLLIVVGVGVESIDIIFGGGEVSLEFVGCCGGD